MKPFPLLFVPLALLLAQCKKADQAPADQLPPATQTGAGTFGCLVNGQPWTPNGFVGLSTNYAVTYDPGYLGGALQVKTYRYTGANDDVYQAMTFGAAGVTGPGAHAFPLAGPNGIYYADYGQLAPCRYFGSLPVPLYQTGTLTLTRFDLTQGIVAGTFSFTMVQAGCDTLKITQGRFDKKL